MVSQTSKQIALQRALENIRQEREIFDMNKRHANLVFLLRYFICWTAIAIIITLFIGSIYILWNSSNFLEKIVNAAIGALFADILGLAASIWKIILSPNMLFREINRKK